MPLITVGTGAPTDIKPGVYEATIVEMVPKRLVTSFTNGEERDFLEWNFALESGEQVNALTSSFSGPKSKAFQWLVALLGPEKVRPGLEIEESDLVGRMCLINITLNAEGWPRVDNLMPMPAKRTQGQAAAEPQFATINPAPPATAGPTIREQVGEGAEGPLPF